MFKINIDGRELCAHQGETILEVAQANQIDIPTLCYDERLESYGGCGLCVVEIEGKPKLFRACATEVSPKMVIRTDSERVRASRKLTLELLLSDHVGDCRGPCVLGCPAHTDVQGYVGLIANGEYREALALIKEILPLPASIGRVCPHPCEEKCRRQLVDAPISIANLKYFVADLDLESSHPYLPEIAPATGKKAAIVGAGPAGLTAAYFLARAGHSVTVFDAMPQAGGMLRYGIPEYRLPKTVLDREIDLIEQMGVKFVYNTKIGQEISLSYLRQNYDTVFIGIGAWESSSIRCQGEDLPGVLGGIDFLREVALNHEVQIGDRVAVVGGGNTAIDAARTAVRLGAKEVTIVYRRTRKEMPAEEEEICAAEAEGVKFKYLVSPVEIKADHGRAIMMRLQQMQLGEPDASGRRRPVPIPGAEETIPVDTVIRAIGQRVQPEGLADLPLTKWGTIAVDDETLATGLPGVFAGGDGVTGPGIAVEAVAQGKKAAESMLAYLAGKEIPVVKEFLMEQHLTSEDFADREKAERIVMPQLKPEERCDNFREVNLGLAEAAVQAEAKRCLECGCRDYFECKLISYANRYGVEPERLAGSKRQEKIKEAETFFERNSEKCILCGLCLRVCDEIMGVSALGLVHRGFESSVQPEFGLPLSQTNCIDCGECVAVCPTGALVEKYPLEKNVPLKLKETRSICSGCGIGCETLIGSRGKLVLRVLPVAGGALCHQGRFGLLAFNRDNRLVSPRLRRNGRLVEASWEEARIEVIKSAQRIRSRYESQGLAVLISPSCTVEEAEAAVDFSRRVLGTDRIACSLPDPGVWLAKVLAGRRYSCSFDELEATDLILMVGSCNKSQVAAVRVRRAVENGAKLVLLSSEETLVDDLASMTLNPDDSTGLIREIVAAAVKGKVIDSGKAEELRTDLAGVEVGSEAAAVAELYTKAQKTVILIDGNQVTAPEVKLLAELALVTGQVDSPRSGLIVVTTGANQAGLRELLTEGPSTTGLLKSVESGDLQGLFVVGEDPVGAGVLTATAMEKLELLVTIAPSLNQTACLADVVLPGSTPLETEGSYLSCDGQVKRLHRVVVPPAGLDNREIFNRLRR